MVHSRSLVHGGSAHRIAFPHTCFLTHKLELRYTQAGVAHGTAHTASRSAALSFFLRWFTRAGTWFLACGVTSTTHTHTHTRTHTHTHTHARTYTRARTHTHTHTHTHPHPHTRARSAQRIITNIDVVIRADLLRKPRLCTSRNECCKFSGLFRAFFVYAFK
jgi:hypothetical protein